MLIYSTFVRMYMAIKLDDSQGSLWSRHVWLDGLWSCIHAASCGVICLVWKKSKTTDIHNSQGRGPWQDYRRRIRSSKFKERSSSKLHHPLATDTHPPGLLDVVTGLHATDKVNADESIKMGLEQMAEFEFGWATIFNMTLTKNAALMTSAKKSIKMDRKSVYMIQNWSTLESYVSNSRPLYRYWYHRCPLIQTFPSIPASLSDENGAYACSIEGSLEDETSSWTIKSDPRSIGRCHHRWMCYVVDWP